MKESELIKCCQQRDKKAQEILYLRYADRLFNLSQRYLKSAEDAEDCVVIGFTRVFDSITRFSYQGEGSLEAWLRKIVINQSLMLLRKSYNFNLTESIDHSIPATDLTEISKLEAEDIMGMIRQLPLGYRTVFSLYVVDGYSHDEISKLLEITESTSRSQLFKARSLLQKMLIKEGYQYGT